MGDLIIKSKKMKAKDLNELCKSGRFEESINYFKVV